MNNHPPGGESPDDSDIEKALAEAAAANDQRERESLERIIAAVDLSDAEVDRKLLRKCLGWCMTWWRTRSALGPKGHQAQRELMEDALGKARRFSQAISNAENWSWLRQRLNLPDTTLREDLALFIEAMERPEATPQSVGKWAGLTDRSAFEVLIGRLSVTFENVFEVPAAVSHTEDTPFLRFTEVVLSENRIVSDSGRPYETSSIIRAFSLSRGGEGRRHSG